jgi:hypothetical protein
MIVERLTFQAKYGQGDALVALMREWQGSFAKQLGLGQSRLFTDLTGTMFTVIAEQEYRDLKELADLQAKQEAMYATPQFQQWFAKMQPLVERGDRQLLSLIEV